MTTTLHLPIQAITAVRLSCRECGAAVVIPLGAKDAPAKCFNCYRDLPGPEVVRGLVRELTWMKQTATGADISFDAGIEAEAASGLKE